jgi:hypothetical protein
MLDFGKTLNVGIIIDAVKTERLNCVGIVLGIF